VPHLKPAGGERQGKEETLPFEGGFTDSGKVSDKKKGGESQESHKSAENVPRVKKRLGAQNASNPKEKLKAGRGS